MVDDILKTEFLDPARPNIPDVDGPQLLTLEGVQPGAVFPLTRDRTEIGRLATNDVVLHSGPVSKRHAAMIRENGLFFLEDLGSTNGVLVNGMRIAADSRRRLYHGDNIRISDHLLLFRQESAFVDASGICSIELDTEQIAAEAEDFLTEWKDLQAGRSSKDKGTQELERP